MNRNFLSLLVIGVILTFAIFLTFRAYRSNKPEALNSKLIEETVASPTSLPESTTSATPSGQQ